MGKRFAVVIGVAAAGVMTLGAQTATAATYNTHLTINQDRALLFHGEVRSGVRKCEVGRRVALFKQQPGADRLLGSSRSALSGGGGASWGLRVPQAKPGWHVYARARREARPDIGLVCRRGRSPIFTVL